MRTTILVLASVALAIVVAGGWRGKTSGIRLRVLSCLPIRGESRAALDTVSCGVVPISRVLVSEDAPEQPEKERVGKAEKESAKEPTGEEGAGTTSDQKGQSPEQSPKEVLASQYRYINSGDYEEDRCTSAKKSRRGSARCRRSCVDWSRELLHRGEQFVTYGAPLDEVLDSDLAAQLKLVLSEPSLKEEFIGFWQAYANAAREDGSAVMRGEHDHEL